jgi:prepilin-type N-terminal cleavage/methylation domain-containing protein
MKAAKKGFTLIELLVVVLIIGILAAIALPQYQRAVKKTRYLSILPTMKAIIDAEERYYLINSKFTLNPNEFDIVIPGDTAFSGTGSGIWAATISGKNYEYQLRADGGTDRAHFWLTGTNRQSQPSGETIGLRYVFSNQKLYCTAYTTDTKGQALCESMFGPAVTCPSQLGGSLKCYAGHF